MHLVQTAPRFILLLSVGLFALGGLAEEAAAPSPAPVKGAAPQSAVEPRPSEAEFDPFAYNRPAKAGEFIPYEEGAIPAGIEVTGIAAPQDGEAVAALYVPGYQALFYVRAGDIIGVSMPTGQTNPDSRSAPVTQSGATSSEGKKKGYMSVAQKRAAKARQAANTADTTQESASRGRQFTLTEEVLYIEVGSITDQQVELHPMTHPENVRILR